MPPIVAAAIATLRSEPGYANETEATLLAILADRAMRPTTGAVTALPATPSTEAEETLADPLDICLDF
jgi:hypothetical protein